MKRNSIDWSDPRLSPGVFEEMIAVLISRLNPGVQRIDGAGGDGGRDVQLPLATGLEIFELKSFTGRLSKDQGRRAQVKRSLIRAAQLNPAAWHLVAPIDPTPGELAWFNELSADYPFACDWKRGRTWLNDQMIAYPDIPRYFLEGAAEEVIQILGELNREQGALAGGIPDLVDRLSTLTRRANDLNPFYTFGHSSTPDGRTTITMSPRYTGADRDHPVRLGGSFRFPETPQGQAAAAAFAETVNYGVPGTVLAEFIEHISLDAPANFGGTFQGMELILGRPDDPDVEQLELTLRILGDQAMTISQLVLFGKARSAGARGGEIVFADEAGGLTVTARLDAPDQRVRLQYDYKQPGGRASPVAMLSVLRFLSEMKPSRSMISLIEGCAIGPAIEIAEPVRAGIDALLELVRDIEEIQRTSGVYFPMPLEFSDEDLVNIRRTLLLLRGETIRGTWTELTWAHPAGVVDQLVARFAGSEVRDFTIRHEHVLKLGDRVIPLGPVDMVYASARMGQLPDPTGLADEADVTVRLVPGADNALSVSMVR